MKEFIANPLQIFLKPEFYLTIIYIFVAMIVYFIVKGIINRIKLNNKRQKTLQNLVIKIIKYTILIFTIIICLDGLGIKVTSFIAGLGIAGVVVGLALQDVMKDVLSGTFIIIGDQFDIGDFVEINGFSGKVVELGVKTTTLEDALGRIKIITNRSITEVINYSKRNLFASVDIPVLYEEKEEILDSIFKDIIVRCEKEIAEIKDEVKITGIESFNNNAVIYKLFAKINFAEQKDIERKMRTIIKEEFDKNKIILVHSK